jgi:hypothetical protein
VASAADGSDDSAVVLVVLLEFNALMHNCCGWLPAVGLRMCQSTVRTLLRQPVRVYCMSCGYGGCMAQRVQWPCAVV